MKSLLIVAAEARYHYVANFLAASLPLAGVVVQGPARRAAPEPCSEGQRQLYEQFVADKRATEARLLTGASELRLPPGAELLYVDGDVANDLAFERFVRSVAPQLMVTLGCSHVGAGLRRRVTHSINMHLGMTPRYRGADGLFWPLYNMDPERLGVSILSIDDDIDAGPIVHHSRPALTATDTLNEIACKAIVAGSQDLLRILKRLSEAAPLITVPARGAGRVYYESALHPRHLHIVDYIMARGLIADYLAEKEVRDAHVTRVCYPGLD